MKRIISNNIITSIEKNISIAWSGKSGSSTVMSLFFDYIKYDCKYNFIHTDRKYYCLIVKQNILLHNDFKNAIVFQVVRNTYHRAVSSYLHFLKRPSKPIWDPLFIPPDLSFIDFLSHIIKEVKQDKTIDMHYDVQTQNITDYIIKNNNIVYLESFTEDIEKINSKYNISLNSKAYYAPHAHNKIYKKPYSEYYKDPLAIKLVKEMYESDIENFKFLPIKS